MPATSATPAGLEISHEPEGTLRVFVSGRWLLGEGVPAATLIARELETSAVRRLVVEATDLQEWDSALVAFVHSLRGLATSRGLALEMQALPQGARKLVELAGAVPARAHAPDQEDDAVTARIGKVALHAWATANDALTFLGETILALVAMLRGRARFRRADLLHAFEAAGVGALGIVALINFLIGAVLAFVGAIQLLQFGAGIYVADLVAIGMTRELSALMTGIVMSGRTGAAFAAVLGTMTVNEEVDALRTMGMKPMEFLVLPRVLATSLMVPALVAYGDALGLLGGAVVGVSLLHLGPMQYAQQTQQALALRHVVIGLVKSLAFGAVVALTGCYYGIRCGRSAAAVGESATKAVVMSIVLVVLVDAFFTVLFYALGL
jgi:phospholipid/cholesterol/gamma-HCH transport system permease protein